MRRTLRRGLSDAVGSWNTICRSGRTLLKPASLESVVSSAPSKRMLPAVGGTSRTRVRATVDLPQPDLPTSPTVSPASTVNDTPSTARTTGGLPSCSARSHAAEPRSGKCVLRSATSHSGGTTILHGEAGDEMLGRHGGHGGLLAPAAILHPRAAAGDSGSRPAELSSDGTEPGIGSMTISRSMRGIERTSARV